MILIVDCGSNKTRYIESMVDEHMDFTTVPLRELTEDHLRDKKGVIFSGAPLLITEINTEPYLERIEWVRNPPVPVLGICFGHQLIGLLFGAFGSRMPEDRHWQKISVLKSCPLFDRMSDEIEMMEDHCETISIPPGFELVAVSDVCVNEAMMHRSKPIYGVQFHPEVSGNQGALLIGNFIRSCQPGSF